MCFNSSASSADAPAERSLAYHQLRNHAEARAWLAKAALPKDAFWEDAMIDRYLRREVEAELKEMKK